MFLLRSSRAWFFSRNVCHLSFRRGSVARSAMALAPAAGKQLVAVFGPAVGQEEVLGELYLQRRGLFVGFVGHEQVDACVFRRHPYIDFVAVRVSQVLLYVGAYQVFACVDGE